MRIIRRPQRAVTTAASRLAGSIREHPRMVAVGVGSAAAAAGALFARSRVDILDQLPDAAELAAETASSVRNAAKSSVIATVREHTEPTRQVALDAVHRVVLEGAAAGADVTAAALGAIEGAVAIAEPLGESRSEMASAAAEVARSTASTVGIVAEQRVSKALVALLPD